jgi:hypothetical protein
MDRRGLVQLLVLDAICDDYENIDQIILPDVARAGKEHNLNIDRAEVVDALGRLVSNGLAKAYFLSSKEPTCREADGMPDVGIVEESFRTYFYITDSGLKYYLSTDVDSVQI